MAVISREAWYRELSKSLEKLGFEPSPPKPGQPLEEWYEEQEKAYALWEQSQQHTTPPPGTPGWRSRAPVERVQERELHRLRMETDPEYRERRRQYSEQQNQIHRERMKTDPEYAEKVREQRKKRKAREREKHRQRMRTDPEYAERVRAKGRARYHRDKARRR